RMVLSYCPTGEPSSWNWSNLGADVTPKEMKELAELLQSLPGIKSVDLKDVRRLAELLRESPEIGSIEVKGWFGTGVVVTRTGAFGGALPSPVAYAPPAAPAPLAPPSGAAPPSAPPASAAPSAPPGLKEIKSPMVGTFY